MTAIHDAAKAAALAERDRAGSGLYRGTPLATDYVVGRCVEAALAVIEGRPVEPFVCDACAMPMAAHGVMAECRPAVVDAASEEVGDG